MSDPATKDDLESFERRLERKIESVKNELEHWMLNREVASIRWLVGTQLAHVVMVIGAVYFIVQHVR